MNAGGKGLDKGFNIVFLRPPLEEQYLVGHYIGAVALIFESKFHVRFRNQANRTAP